MSDSKFKLEFSEKLDKVIFETGNASLYIKTKPSSSVTMKDLILPFRMIFQTGFLLNMK